MINDNDILLLDVEALTQEGWQKLKPLLIKLKIRWKWIEDYANK